MKAHKEDWFLRGRQTAFLIYEYFRVTGANDSVENYADLFTVVLRNDDVQEFHQKDGEKNARTERRKQDCGDIEANGDEPDQSFSYKFFT